MLSSSVIFYSNIMAQDTKVRNCTKFYSFDWKILRIILDVLKHLFCSKLCWHNLLGLALTLEWKPHEVMESSHLIIFNALCMWLT